MDRGQCIGVLFPCEKENYYCKIDKKKVCKFTGIIYFTSTYNYNTSYNAKLFGTNGPILGKF